MLGEPFQLLLLVDLSMRELGGKTKLQSHGRWLELAGTLIKQPPPISNR